MAIDIRATVTCSLGTLISGSISDDYIQGSGLVKTRGSVEINALITPAIGTAVTFSYTKGGVARSIPRKLRVMSSFADPFRRTTKVELGCKLTYLSDLKEPIDWTAFDDPQNAAYNETDSRIVTLPLYASSVMNKCLSELGITASSNPLTNKFSIAEFDFGAGYVPVLSDLLVSESYCGYLDTNEVLQVFNLDQDAGTGPVFTASDIVDLGPIGVGSLPGEAVTVSYSTLKLKDPDSTNNSSDPWIYTVSRGAQQSIKVGPSTYSYIPETVTETEYEAGGDRRIVKQTVTKTSIAAEAGGSYLEAVYAELGTFPVAPGAVITEVSTTTYEYNIGAITVQLPNGSWYYTSGEIQRATTLVEESILRIIASFNLPWVVESSAYAATTDTSVSRKTIQIDETVSGYTRSITNEYAIYGYTQEGQQLIALVGQNIDTLANLNGYVSTLLSTGALIFTDTSVNIQYGDSRLNNRLPPVEDINNAAYAKGGDPNNGWRTESLADLELALGSATAQRRIEFSMPYAPDDTFSGPSGGPFTATPSDAPAKAMRYGRVQNRLLLGNRNGVNLQLAPEKLPAAPYSPLYLQASGLTALYRANGTNWAFDSNGIVCSVDALFWAAVGGTGTFWFPVAPGITTLPAEPPIVDGAMNANTVVLPYNETAVYDSRIRTTTTVTKFDYTLTLLTEVPAAPIKIKVNIIVKRGFAASTGLFELTGQAAQFNRPARVLRADAGTFALTDQFVRLKPDRLDTSDPGIFTLNLQSAPLSYSGGDAYWNSVKLLLHMEGTDFGTTFIDSGPLALTVTTQDAVVIRTTQFKYGVSSAYFDGVSDRLFLDDSDAWNLGSGNFTIEAWIRPGATSIFPIASQRLNSSTDVGWEFFVNSSAMTFTCNLTGSGGAASRTDNASYSGFAVDTWSHVAVTRSGGTLYFHRNGTLIASYIFSGTIYNSTSPLAIGGRGGSSNSAFGFIDEVRITRSARYTTDFTAPTKAFPDGPQTV